MLAGRIAADVTSVKIGGPVCSGLGNLGEDSGSATGIEGE
jgi:hypothetical protein